MRSVASPPFWGYVGDQLIYERYQGSCRNCPFRSRVLRFLHYSVLDTKACSVSLVLEELRAPGAGLVPTEQYQCGTPGLQHVLKMDSLCGEWVFPESCKALSWAGLGEHADVNRALSSLRGQCPVEVSWPGSEARQRECSIVKSLSFIS